MLGIPNKREGAMHWRPRRPNSNSLPALRSWVRVTNRTRDTAHRRQSGCQARYRSKRNPDFPAYCAPLGSANLAAALFKSSRIILPIMTHASGVPVSLSPRLNSTLAALASAWYLVRNASRVSSSSSSKSRRALCAPLVARISSSSFT